MEVVTFCNSVPVELDKEVNEWLKDNPDIEIKFTKEFGLPPEGNFIDVTFKDRKPDPNPYIVVSIWYSHRSRGRKKNKTQIGNGD